MNKKIISLIVALVVALGGAGFLGFRVSQERSTRLSTATELEESRAQYTQLQQDRKSVV